MGMGFAPTWLHQVSPPLLHKTTLTTDPIFMPETAKSTNKNNPGLAASYDIELGN